MAYARFYEGMNTVKWAELQLQGVLSQDDPRYRHDLAHIGMIFLDCAEMQWGTQYQQDVRQYASEWEPKSWSWLV